MLVLTSQMSVGLFAQQHLEPAYLLPPAPINPDGNSISDAWVESGPLYSSCQSSGFYVVSSRRLCQNKLQTCAPGAMDYCYCGDGQALTCSSYEAFRGWLNPSIPVCVYVHGSFVTWETVMQDSCATYRWLKSSACGRPVQVVFFTWPSDEPFTHVPLLDARHLGERAGFNGLYLQQLIEELPVTAPVSLIGHSHGARVVSSALHLRSGGEVEGYCACVPAQPRRIRVVFAAAAIDHDWLNPGHRYERALWSVECLMNLKNSHDAALALYPLLRPFSKRAIGKAGFTNRDQQEIGQQAAKISQIDVTPLIRLRHVWPNYLADVKLSHAISNYIYFNGI